MPSLSKMRNRYFLMVCSLRQSSRSTSRLLKPSTSYHLLFARGKQSHSPRIDHVQRGHLPQGFDEVLYLAKFWTNYSRMPCCSSCRLIWKASVSHCSMPWERAFASWPAIFPRIGNWKQCGRHYLWSHVARDIEVSYLTLAAGNNVPKPAAPAPATGYRPRAA